MNYTKFGSRPGLGLGALRDCRYLTFGILVAASPGWAGGLYIREYGQPSQATAGAGATVFAQDASTAFQNPAGVFYLDKDINWMVTGAVLNSKIKFESDKETTIPGDNGGDAGDTVYGGAFFYTRRYSDQWGGSLSLNSISGSAVDYGNNFSGRYLGYETELLTVTMTPSVAYKFNESLSFAFSVPVLYGELDLKAAVPPLLGQPTPDRDGQVKIEDGDDLSATVALFALWQVNDDVRLALNWIGENELKFNGDLSIDLPGLGSGTSLSNVATDIEITLPQALSLSGAWFLTDQLAIATRLGWEQWSELDAVPISTSEQGAAIPTEWDDVWNIATGLRYSPPGKIRWYTGVAYDSDPAEDEFRIPILPADEQWRFAGGLTYDLPKDRKVGISVTYVDLGDARIENSGDVGQFSGEYDTNRLIFVGLNFAW